MRRSCVLIVAALSGIVAATQIPEIDMWLSDHAYNVVSGQWSINHDRGMFRPILYDGPKALLILFAVTLLAAIIKRDWLPRLRLNRSEALFLLLCLAIVPSVNNLIRAHTAVTCPRLIQHYGGDMADELGHLDVSRLSTETQPGKCWPSGHASGGFALLCLAFLNRSRRTRIQFGLFGLTVGGAMGAYQVLRGAHFASHIVVSLLLALTVMQLIDLAMRYARCDFRVEPKKSCGQRSPKQRALAYDDWWRAGKTRLIGAVLQTKNS